MNEFTFELNSARRDDRVVNADIKKTSPIVEVYSAMSDGSSLDRFGEKGNKSVEYIRSLADRASNSDAMAISEINQIRRYTIEPLITEEARILELFGGYQAVGEGESIEREVYNYVGGGARMQATNGDVPFAALNSEKYTVTPVTISGGFVNDYRRIANGDMEKENYGLMSVRTDIMNKAAAYVMKVIYKSIKNATGVKYWSEASGITKLSLDTIIKQVRRFGPANIVGAYAVASQINAMAGWSDGAASTPLRGISDKAMDEIRENGLLFRYGGCNVREIPVGLDFQKMNAAGTDFATTVPEGLLFVLPTGLKSPVMTWTRGGLTSMTGNDVATGKNMTRFDIDVAADVAKGHEFEIGLLNDTGVTAAADYAI